VSATYLTMMSMLMPLVRTIHGMVYHALKLFMEINPEVFDSTMQEYKQKKIE